MTKNWMIFAVLVASLLIGACSTQKKNKQMTSAGTLENVTWRLVELNGKSVAEQINGKVPSLKLMSEDKRYAAVTGCNGIGGNYTASEGNLLSFSAGMSTKMFCEGAMEVEDGLSKAFPLVYGYEMKADRLVLKDGEGKKLAEFTLMP